MIEDIGLKSQEDINFIFKQAEEVVYDKVNEMVRVYSLSMMQDISKKWASGVAVDFANTYKEKMEDALKTWRDNFDSFLQAVSRKIEKYAQENQSDIHAPSIYFLSYGYIDISPIKDKFEDGSEGMKEGFNSLDLIRELEKLELSFEDMIYNHHLQCLYGLFQSPEDNKQVAEEAERLVDLLYTTIKEIEEYVADKLNISQEQLEAIRNKEI